MVFSSIPFLYWFLPAVLVLYFLVPGPGKNAVLLAASLLFYAWGEPRYLVLMLAEIAVGYGTGLILAAGRRTRAAKPLLAVSVLIPLALLAYFKYAGFLVQNVNALTGAKFSVPQIALPVGISFYTFQIVSYQADVYRGEVPPQKNPLLLALYVSMFPQLIAGPIVRYADIEQQLRERTCSLEAAADGARRFVIGLAKKVLLANVLGELCAQGLGTAEPSVLSAWLGAAAYTLQIYFDFSAYSDMAIGLGRILGFHFAENFRYPYTAGSITEFWRRWHISLGTWFRDYVYIPLGGNRVSAPRRLLNLLLVWMLTGIWHGAAWNFAVWGLYFAVLLIAEKWWLLPRLERMPVLRHVYVLFAVMVGFLIFQAADLGAAARGIGRLFGLGHIPAVTPEALYDLRSYAVILAVSVIGATKLPLRVLAWLRRTKTGKSCLELAEPVWLLAVLLTATAYLVDGSFNPFLYFRF